jgi:hypothetical protein
MSRRIVVQVRKARRRERARRYRKISRLDKIRRMIDFAAKGFVFIYRDLFDLFIFPSRDLCYIFLKVLMGGTMKEEEISVKIREAAKDGKIPCVLAMKIAAENKISNKQMGELLNRLKIKIAQCQLGCF